MHTISLALVSFLASLAAAVSVPGLPKCAGNCVTSFGSCSQLNVQCICSDQSLLANLACCVSKECDAADQEATIKFADSLCAGQGVTNLPQSATCAPGASTGPVAASTGSSTSRVTPIPQGGHTTSSGNAVASASSSVQSAESSASAAVSSASSSDMSAVSSASTSAASAQSSASAAASSAAASASASSGAGHDGLDKMGLGLVVAGIVAAL